MTMQLAGFTVSVQQAIEIIYIEIDIDQLLTDIEALLSAHDGTPSADDSAALLLADIERWLAEQDLSAMETNLAVQRDMDEQYYQGWMT